MAQYAHSKENSLCVLYIDFHRCITGREITVELLAVALELILVDGYDGVDFTCRHVKHGPIFIFIYY